MKKNTPPFLFSLVTILMLISLPIIVQATTVTVSVTANNAYNRLDRAVISGILSQDDSPVSNGLVAIQIVYPDNDILTLRTLNTGSNPSNPTVTIQSIQLTDSEGNPISTTPKNDLASFKVLVTNNAQQAQQVLISVNAYDNFNVPIGFSSSQSSIPARETRLVILSIPIPSTARTGVARVFAGAYSNSIDFGGIPYCPEKSSTFGIINQDGSVPLDTPTGSQGHYSLPLNLPINAPIGTYTAYVSSLYNGALAVSSTIFQVNQAGDFNNDGKVTSADITSFLIAYSNYWISLPYDSRADMDHNGAMSSADITLFCFAYSQYWSWH